MEDFKGTFKGTPGQWIVSSRNGTTETPYWYVESKNDPDGFVARIYDEFDAKLIAAAPELLETLTKLHQAISSGNVHTLSEWNYKAKVLTHEILKP